MHKIHPGWRMLFFIVLSVLACLGFGRFALGAIIPFMKDGLMLTYSETGLVASSVFLGYLISVTTVGYFVLRYSAKTVIIFSLFLIASGMFLLANASGFWMAYVGAMVTGIGSGGTYIPSLGLVGQWFTKERKGMAMGIAMAGSGIGIVFSGLAVPELVSIHAEEGWRFSWNILGGAVMVIAVLNWIFLKNSPEECDVEPIAKAEQALHRGSSKKMEGQGNARDQVYRNRQVLSTGFIYLSWGFSYIIFSTFLVDFLMKDAGLDKAMAGKYFALAGLISIISGFIWGSLSDRIGRMATLSLVYVIQSVMLLSMSLTTSHLFLFLFIIIYSVTLWGTPTIMNASVSDYVPAIYVPVAMGFITLFFSIGQFISPMITGYLIDVSGKYTFALLLSAGVSLLGGFGCIHMNAVQRKSGIARATAK